MCHVIIWDRNIPGTIRPARCTSAFGRMTDPESAKQALPRVRSEPRQVGWIMRGQGLGFAGSD